MNVISIFGGSRKRGNTATALGSVEDELKTLGHQVERIDISSKTDTDNVSKNARLQ